MRFRLPYGSTKNRGLDGLHVVAGGGVELSQLGFLSKAALEGGRALSPLVQDRHGR